MRQPLYPTHDRLPFRAWLKAQKIIRDNPPPQDRATELVSLYGEMELVQLLYGLDEADVHNMHWSEYIDLRDAILPVWSRPPAVDTELTEYTWQGTTYTWDRDPLDVAVLEMKHIEDIRHKFADEYDQQLFILALLVTRKGEPYGNGRERYTDERLEMLSAWPTPVCLSVLSFFLRKSIDWPMLIRLSTELDNLMAAMQAMTGGPNG